MKGRICISLMYAALAASFALSSPAIAAEAGDAAKNEASAANAAKPDKPLKPVRVKAPPKPKVATVVAPGTWEVHRHRGNSPKFRPDREKDWVDPSGGKKPVKGKN